MHKYNQSVRGKKLSVQGKEGSGPPQFKVLSGASIEMLWGQTTNVIVKYRSRTIVRARGSCATQEGQAQ
uniref:Uncharacterized protein n=1 Tax=Picea glauca TaxID=3330 RepID=A0A101LYN2_PICGL|nr:hypothetical protein ABT39_MTgene4788 [Picea glauca]